MYIHQQQVFRLNCWSAVLWFCSIQLRINFIYVVWRNYSHIHGQYERHIRSSSMLYVRVRIYVTILCLCVAIVAYVSRECIWHYAPLLKCVRHQSKQYTSYIWFWWKRELCMFFSGICWWNINLEKFRMRRVRVSEEKLDIWNFDEHV